MANKKGASINPDSFIEGGLVDDVDARINTARWVSWDYNGQQDPSLALHLNFTTKEGDTYDQYYSGGDLKRVYPDPDTEGRTLLPEDAKLVIKSNAGQLIISAIMAGFPKNRLTDDISVFDGCGVHLKRKAQPERMGLKQKDKPEGRQSTVLEVTSILWLPGETPKFQIAAKGVNQASSTGVSAAPASTGAPAGIPTPAAATDYSQKTVEHMLNVLSANGGSVAKGVLPQALFKSCQAAGDTAIQAGILSLAYKNDWLTSSERPWKVDASGVISLG